MLNSSTASTLPSSRVDGIDDLHAELADRLDAPPEDSHAGGNVRAAAGIRGLTLISASSPLASDVDNPGPGQSVGIQADDANLDRRLKPLAEAVVVAAMTLNSTSTVSRSRCRRMAILVVGVYRRDREHAGRREKADSCPPAEPCQACGVQKRPPWRIDTQQREVRVMDSGRPGDGGVYARFPASRGKKVIPTE